MTPTNPTPQIAIVTALRLEAKAIAKALGVRIGEIGSPRRRKEILVLVRDVGVGAPDLSAVEELTRSKCVVVAGLAGALDPTLKVGDVVVDAANLPPIEKLKARFGKLHTADQLASTADMKAKLWRETGALAVEMEQVAVERALAGTSIPIIGVRAISDTAGEALSPALLSLVDEHGAPKPMKLASSIARRPTLLRELFRLAKASRKATRTMAAAVRTIVESGLI